MGRFNLCEGCFGEYIWSFYSYLGTLALYETSPNKIYFYYSYPPSFIGILFGIAFCINLFKLMLDSLFLRYVWHNLVLNIFYLVFLGRKCNILWGWQIVAAIVPSHCVPYVFHYMYSLYIHSYFMWDK